MHFAQVRRTGASFEVVKMFSLDLPASPLHGDSAALGQAIRAALLQNNLKEHRCVVGFPVQGVLSMPAKIPELPESDVADFLNLEAERGFAYDPESLFVSSSRCQFSSGEDYADIAGVQREQVVNLQAALQAAKLKILSITIGLAATQRVYPGSAGAELLLVLGKSSVEVGVTCGEGLFAMRSLETEEGAAADVIGRELRVTFGQIPAELRGQLVNARIFGEAGEVARLKAELAPRLRAMGLAAEGAGGDAGLFVCAVAPAAAYLLGKRSSFEFLPPKVSAWKQFAGTTSARKLGSVAGIAAALAVILIVSFLIQGWHLSQLQSRWSSISPRVTELEDMQQRIKKFRPWFDNSFRSLTILRKITEAFPADGVVTAKTLEIRNQSQVNCSGVARDNQALFKMLDQLRSTKEVAEVKMDQIRGKNPLQFNFNFRWVEGGTGEH